MVLTIPGLCARWPKNICESFRPRIGAIFDGCLAATNLIFCFLTAPARSGDRALPTVEDKCIESPSCPANFLLPLHGATSYYPLWEQSFRYITFSQKSKYLCCIIENCYKLFHVTFLSGAPPMATSGSAPDFLPILLLSPLFFNTFSLNC